MGCCQRMIGQMSGTVGPMDLAVVGWMSGGETAVQFVSDCLGGVCRSVCVVCQFSSLS